MFTKKSISTCLLRQQQPALFTAGRMDLLGCSCRIRALPLGWRKLSVSFAGHSLECFNTIHNMIIEYHQYNTYIGYSIDTFFYKPLYS